MIEIVYDRRRNALTCTGHANSAQAGRDIVCAACSMLVYGLADSIAKLSDRSDLTLESGKAVIACRLQKMTRRQRAKVDAVFWGYRNAFWLLADRYPAFVVYREK